MSSVTIGIGGAAGDGLDKTGDTLAKTASRLGLYVHAYNSYQSIIRGGHIWLRVRLGQEKVASHGDDLNALIALNQDAIERHAAEVDPGGVVLFNADKLRCNVPLAETILAAPLPVGELTKPFGAIQPIMQNTVALGALLFLLDLDFQVTAEVFADTFEHKGKAVVDQNVNLARAGYDYARERFVPLGCQWKFTQAPAVHHRKRGLLPGRRRRRLQILFGLSHDSGIGHSALDGRTRRALRHRGQTVRG